MQAHGIVMQHYGAYETTEYGVTTNGLSGESQLKGVLPVFVAR
jgi:hypothetical protein